MVRTVRYLVRTFRYLVRTVQYRSALSYKCPGVMEVVVEEVFSTAEYYPIMFLDFSSFLSNNFFNNRRKKTLCKN